MVSTSLVLGTKYAFLGWMGSLFNGARSRAIVNSQRTKKIESDLFHSCEQQPLQPRSPYDDG